MELTEPSLVLRPPFAPDFAHGSTLGDVARSLVTAGDSHV